MTPARTQVPVHLHDILDAAARSYPDAPAVIWQETTLTYRELAAASTSAAHVLHGHGVRRGERVLVSTEDRHAVAAIVYAASRLGAVFSVIHEDVCGAPLTHVLDDAEPALLITEDEAAERTAQECGVPCLRTAELRSGAAPDGLPDPGLTTDPACLIYTSGTTSLPKAVVSTHQQMLYAVHAIQAELNLRSDDIVHCPLPLSFDYGLYQLFLATVSGATLRLATVSEAGPPLLRSLQRSGATVLAGVPSVSGTLAWLAKRAPGAPLPKLRLLTNTGADLPARTMADLREHLPSLRIQVMYGLTECKRATIMEPDGDLKRPVSCGRPLRGTEIVILDDAGAELPPGEVGQIVIRGPHVMAGYWRRPELTAQRFPRREGLFPELHTGDYGHLDADGYLYFSGRRDDLYKERGFRVSCTEVEAAALRIPDVTAAAVLPPADGRTSVLVVVTGLTKEEVLDRLREQIEPYKVPRRCLLLPELPLNGNGKVDRTRLKALAER
ncbi:AMP-dependent synthetase and ligase [Streptomyces kronopolitis]|uniref:AMP-dependent synthetase and ligase n=1 Tax=Streptomyces kronopolitis TaxID=1612435 RepID=A0ABQ2JSZ4_9ACTN|nr:class I adenylate-forming enzyme family protein [Streptomyces kronopolitis]GGN56364.1 AMP-dependent synthetase and ligase [Streptomyces kronopolitis]